MGSLRTRGQALLALLLTAWAAAPASAEVMNLVITNSNTDFTDDNVYVSFETTASVLTGTYGGTNPFQLINSATYTYINGTGGTGTSTQTQYWTTPLTLAQLNAGSGMSFAKATSVRAYVSLGQPLVFSGSGANGGLLSFGAPSYTNTNDPNWNVRWDVFEFTVTPAPGDQGDTTAINAIGIPMRMTSFIGSGTVQSVQTATDFGTLLTGLRNYQTANAANNSSNLPTYATTSGSFTRIVGINNGAQAGSTSISNGLGGIGYSSSGGATIGANATFGSYVSAVGSGSIATPLAMSQTAANGGNVAGAYGFTAVASAVPWVTSGSTPYNPNGNFTAQWPVTSGTVTVTNSGTLTNLTTGGSGYAVQVSGTFLNATTGVGTFNVWVPPDVITGSGTNYIQSATLYAGTGVANYGVIFQWQASGSAAPETYYYANDFISAVNATTEGNGLPLIQQVFHDLAAGYNFGLIGSNLIDPLSGLSFNDEGSSYWTLWENLKNGGTAITATGTWSLTGAGGTQIPQVTGLAPGQMPFYALAQGTANGHYNQWAALIYASSPTAYGNPYSDYLQQVDVNVLSSPGQTTNDITQVRVTILPDDLSAPIPEPTAMALVIAGGATLGGVEWRRRRRSRAARG